MYRRRDLKKLNTEYELLLILAAASVLLQSLNRPLAQITFVLFYMQHTLYINQKFNKFFSV